jgi:hypothetical protein
MIQQSNATHPIAQIQWEQFPMGVIFLVFAAIALIWLFCLRSIFKSQISLQRQLFAFIFLDFLARGIQMGIVHNFCFRWQGHLDECRYLSNFSQTLDLFASAFDFTIYLVLVAFWAEQYYSMTRSGDPRSTLNIRKQINVVFWVLFVIRYDSYVCN